MIPTLFRDSKVKKGFIHSRLRRYVPHRVGIEFECFGDFANSAVLNGRTSWKNWEDIERYYGVLDFSQEESLAHRNSKYLNPEQLSEVKNEIRVSIQDYRQLNGLYNILNDMSKYCFISPDCGIHIHVDLTKYGKDYQKKKAVDWFNKHLHEVESIFPPYTGTYNKRIAQRGKSSWVNLSAHDTVEFRIAPLTFDYELLITWIVKCSKLVSRMILECHLSEKSKEQVNVVKKESTRISSNDGWVQVNLNDQLNSLSNRLNSINRELQELNAANGEMDHEVTADVMHQVALDRLLRRLSLEGIEYYISQGELIMDYPDGIRADIRLDRAISSFLDGGLESVIRTAHAMIPSNLSGNSRRYSDMGYTEFTDGGTYISSDNGTLSATYTSYW